MSKPEGTLPSDKGMGSSSSDGESSRRSRPSARSAKEERGYLEEGLNRQPLKFDSQFQADLEATGNSKDHQWRNLMKEEWKDNWESTSVDSDARRVDMSGKGKGKANMTPFNSIGQQTSKEERQGHHPIMMRPRRSKVDRTLQWTKQRAPFDCAEIGKLAAERPHSIGLFKPDYPFTPSGRKRKHLSSTSSEPGSVPTTFQYQYSLSPTIVYSNVMKHGWTSAVLDDDVKLSVPDESRRSRQTSLYTRELLGKKWFRWRPGEGWVYCRTKDLSAYRRGPGIALGNLLPPRDKAVTSQLPWIPNDSKRDFVWVLIACMVFFGLIALTQEVRQHWRRKRKGKRPNRPVSNGGLIRPRSASSTNASKNRKVRQRTQAQRFRDLCRFALRKSVNEVGQAASRTSSGVAANIRWASHIDGTSTGLVTGSAAIRRGPSHFIQHNVDEIEGANIELLEKGGVEGSCTSPVIENGHFDLHQVAVPSPAFSKERSN